MNKRLLVICLLLIVAIASGIAYDHHRAKERRQIAAQRAAAAEQAKPKIPPLPVWGSLLPAGDDVEVSGSAICGFCHWREGGTWCNTVLQMSTEPGIVFVLPNETRTEMEKLTGECGAGNYYVTARGTVSQYGGRNYLLAKSFSAVKTK